MGRFLSQDPLGFDAGDYNLYRYAFNSPVNLTDPSGQIPIDTALDVIFIAYDAVMIAGDIYKLVTSDECDKAELYLALNIDLLALGLDFLSLFTPYFTGGGLGYRLGVAGTNITVDAVRVAAPVAIESLVRGTQAAVKGAQIGRTIWLAKDSGNNGGRRKLPEGLEPGKEPDPSIWRKVGEGQATSTKKDARPGAMKVWEIYENSQGELWVRDRLIGTGRGRHDHYEPYNPVKHGPISP